MKKIFAIMLAIVMMLSLCACGNMSLGWGNFNFTHIHFSDACESHCATITKWYDNERGIEVVTEEYGSMFLSEGSYILIESGDKCPYCASASNEQE